MLLWNKATKLIFLLENNHYFQTHRDTETKLTKRTKEVYLLAWRDPLEGVLLNVKAALLYIVKMTTRGRVYRYFAKVIALDINWNYPLISHQFLIITNEPWNLSGSYCKVLSIFKSCPQVNFKFYVIQQILQNNNVISNPSCVLISWIFYNSFTLGIRNKVIRKLEMLEWSWRKKLR